MPDLKISDADGDGLVMKQYDSHFYLEFTMLGGMAQFTVELTKDEGIALASYVAACVTSGRWK